MMWKKLSNIRRYFVQAANLMVGVPDYDVYVAHMQKHHPTQHCMTLEEFVRNRQDARYGGKSGGRCC